MPVNPLVWMLSNERPGWTLALCRVGVATAAMIRGLKTVRDMYLLQHDPATIPARLFDWAPRMAATWEIALFGLLWMAAATSLLVGYRARLGASVLLALSLFQHVVDQNYWAHHMYFLMLLLGLLAVSDADTTLSVRWVRNGYSEGWVRGWPVWLLKMQLSIAYFYSAAFKVNDGFLSGAILAERLWLPEFFRQPEMIRLLAAGTVGAEFFLAFALWNRRLRPAALFVGAMLHGLIPVLMGPYAGLIVFSLLIFSVYVLFLDDRVRVPSTV